MGFLDALSDDQLALLGCAGAFLLFGGLMSLSYYIGRGGSVATESAPSAERKFLASRRAGEDPSRPEDRKAA